MNSDTLYDADYLKRRHGSLDWYHDWMAKDRANRIWTHGGVRPGSKILEVGCDRGRLLSLLSARGAETYGVDVNEEAVRACANPHIRVGNAMELPFEAGLFDCVVASHVIEHLPEPKRLLLEAVRVLKPSGSLLLWYPFELFRGMTVLPELIAYRKPLRLARQYHLHIFWPATLRSVAAEAGLLECTWRWCVYGPIPEFMSVYRLLD